MLVRYIEMLTGTVIILFQITSQKLFCCNCCKSPIMIRIPCSTHHFHHCDCFTALWISPELKTGEEVGIFSMYYNYGEISHSTTISKLEKMTRVSLVVVLCLPSFAFVIAAKTFSSTKIRGETNQCPCSCTGLRRASALQHSC